jgi:hypothetical protein
LAAVGYAPPTAGVELPREVGFVCSAYSAGATQRKDRKTRERELHQVRASGITTFGPQYEANDSVVSEAAALGATAIFTPGDTHKLDEAIQRGDRLVADAREDVERLAGSDTIILWDLPIEEPRPWREEEMALFRKLSKVVEEADPQDRPILVYTPAHRTVEQLTIIASETDGLLVGLYPTTRGFGPDRLYVAHVLHKMSAALEATPETHEVFMPVIEMFIDPPLPAGVTPDQAVQHDIVRSIIEGADAIAIFSFRPRKKFTKYAAYRAGLAELLPLVCGKTPIARAVTEGERLKNVFATQAKVRKTNKSGKVTFEAAAVAGAVFTLRGRRFLLLANSDAIQQSIGVTPAVQEKDFACELFASSPGAVKRNGRTLTLAPLASAIFSNEC